ncbi:MAG TPA: valine--tRNA ligase [Acidimicrobiales bacterium]|nr:valine--tRNA ligase [Acidimicrobiales bacterium]
MNEPVQGAEASPVQGARIPERPSIDGLEDKWSRLWESQGTYRFDRNKIRTEIFAIDTPPPTVSGALHMGSVFGYVQTDAIARYRRMRGWELFYPMGWDDNGLPTERRVQNYFGVRCDPSLAYDPDFEPPGNPPDPAVSISRPNFIELCHKLTSQDEQAFEDLWRRLGLSVDWTQTYATIGDRARRASQRMFLRNLARGEAYSAEAPTLWDVDHQTAVAQAELEDREVAGAYHRLRFDDIVIETTRPELLAACVALVAHPDDARYTGRFGTSVHSPLFGTEVPVLAHGLADPDKGTGIAMVCTFGDLTDVIWWRELQLPIRAIVTRNGRISTQPPPGLSESPAWRELSGKTLAAARKRIVELLAQSGDLVGEPRPITHPVKFYERGERPLEIVTSRQWYIRNGGRDEPLREAMRQRGEELDWHPSSMHARYENWVGGLNGDWLISRQRFFGVPFPLWYPLEPGGTVDYEHPLLPDEGRLPLDPTTEAPAGYTESQRGEPHGFVGETDVMDTWATSSLTPQIASGWEDDPDLFERVFPMDLRPQGPEIIRTWLFATALRSHFEHGRLPWQNAAINGWVLDPERKKMSKSKGNVITPVGLLEQHGSDAVRYWAASGRPGVDTAFDDAQVKVGRRLAIKVLNASRFALGRKDVGGYTTAEAVSAPIDLAMLAGLAEMITEATKAFDAYDYARALERTEAFFWSFCDDYLELVKARSYEPGDLPEAVSARAALGIALSVQLRLLAPFLPFVSEEVWSWWHEGSIHKERWPEVAELPVEALAAGTAVLDMASYVLGEVRKAKTTAKRSMRAEVSRLTVIDEPGRLWLLAQAESDLRQAGSVLDLVTGPGDQAVMVELAPE